MPIFRRELDLLMVVLVLANLFMVAWNLRVLSGGGVALNSLAAATPIVTRQVAKAQQARLDALIRKASAEADIAAALAARVQRGEGAVLTGEPMTTRPM